MSGIPPDVAEANGEVFGIEDGGWRAVLPVGSRAQVNLAVLLDTQRSPAAWKDGSPNTGAETFVQPFLDALGEEAAELEFRFVRPWLRVLYEDDLTVLAPLGELGMGEGFAEAKVRNCITPTCCQLT